MEDRWALEAASIFKEQMDAFKDKRRKREQDERGLDTEHCQKGYCRGRRCRLLLLMGRIRSLRSHVV